MMAVRSARDQSVTATTYEALDEALHLSLSAI